LPPDLLPTLKSVVRLLTPQFLLSARYERHFFRSRRWENLHLGVFESFEAAREFAARRDVVPRFDLDHEAWLKQRVRLSPHDYPMLFWLGRTFEEGMRVVDLGGSVGVSCYAFRPFMHFPEGLQWQVCELEDVVPLGRRIAQERGESALSFTSDLASLEGANVLFTAGTLQYIESSLAQLLAVLANPPKHLLINRIPLTRRRSSFVTLQNGGEGVQAYRISNAKEFVDDLERLGYREVDRWKCLENSAPIPLHPDLSLSNFDGFYFVREAHR
jgi:putative methyltransferase (TIGR04325 family)